MVRTRGGGSQDDRLHPITSVRRRERRYVNEDEEHEDAKHVEHEPEEA